MNNEKLIFGCAYITAMVYYRIKKKGTKKYNYLVKGFKFNGKVYQIQKYIGYDRLNTEEIEELKLKFENWFVKEIINKKAMLSSNNYYSKIFSRNQIITLEKIKFAFEEFMKNLHPNEREILEGDFNVKYIYSTTATEGNTCTLAEVTRILEESLSPKGKNLREIYEVRNFNDVLSFRKNYRNDLNRNFISKLHELIMKDIDQYTLGTFRRIEVAIRGSDLKPVPAIFIEEEIEKLIIWYQKNKTGLHPVELAMHCHVRFEEIHPFTDGNGRVGREIFNFIINRDGYPSLNFDVIKRDQYLDGLESANSGDFKPMANYIIDNYLEQMRVRLGNNPLKDIILD